MNFLVTMNNECGLLAFPTVNSSETKERKEKHEFEKLYKIINDDDGCLDLVCVLEGKWKGTAAVMIWRRQQKERVWRNVFKSISYTFLDLS